MFRVIKLPTVRFLEKPMFISATTARSYVDLNTLTPALDIIAEHPDTICRYETDRAAYYSLDELINFGNKTGLEFVLLNEIDPGWKEYLSLSRKVAKDVDRLKELEVQYGVNSAHELSAHVPESHTYAFAPIPLVDNGEDTEEQRIIADLIARAEASKRQHKREKTALQREINALRNAFNAELSDYAGLLEEAMRPLSLPTVDVMLNLVPKKRRRYTSSGAPAFIFTGDILTKQLVDGFEDGISWDKLSPQLKKGSAAKVSGIYFLLDDEDKVIYVGQSVNILARIGQHLDDEKKSKYFNKVAAVAVPEDRLNEVEKLYIRLYAPPFNHNSGTGIQYMTQLQRRRRTMKRKLEMHPELSEMIHARAGDRA